jgi:hypothetical protein
MGIRLTGSTSSAEMACGSGSVRWNGISAVVDGKEDGWGRANHSKMLHKDIV